MFQVCFTADFAEEGKGSREGYSIYYYARAGARASGSCGKEPERWKFLPDGAEKISERMEFFIGWHKKNPEILPEEGKKCSSGRKIHSGKCGFFCRKIPKEARKWWKRGEKFLSPVGKKHKNYPDDEEKHVRNWVMETPKSGFFFQKSFKKAKKLWKQTENFLSST